MTSFDSSILCRFSRINEVVGNMMFETKYVNEIIKIVEDYHSDTFYNVFLKNVTELDASGASEYELYFNYIINKGTTIRPLYWKNTNKLEENYDYVSCHWYIR
jgi:hypothetical protein